MIRNGAITLGTMWLRMIRAWPKPQPLGTVGLALVLVMAVTVFGFSLFGNALRDAIDPKMRER